MNRSHVVKQLSICMRVPRQGWPATGDMAGPETERRLACPPIALPNQLPDDTAGPCWRGASFGIMIVTLVPLPGVEAIPMLPPNMPVTTL
jgi:hypothetical protein